MKSFTVLAAVFLAIASVAEARRGYTQVNLVSDVPGVARVTDANLVNPWSIAITPSGRIWVADNATGVSTIYLPDGTPVPLAVTVPPAAPTGVVFNDTGAFIVTEGTNSGPSRFIFVTEAGTVAGWSPLANPTSAIVMVDNFAASAVYKGIARVGE